MNNPELPEPITFEWGEYNKAKIRLKHNTTPEDAEQTFFNERLIIFDQKHSAIEERYQLLGMNNNSSVLFIVFTIRNNKIRVISARSASKKERSIYGKKT